MEHKIMIVTANIPPLPEMPPIPEIHIGVWGWIAIATVFALFIWLAIFIIRIPIIVAKHRGIGGRNLGMITLLSWLGILFGLTWIIALVLAIVRDPDDVPKSTGHVALDKLDRLHALLKKGAISKAEYEREKKKILEK